MIHIEIPTRAKLREFKRLIKLCQYGKLDETILSNEELLLKSRFIRNRTSEYFDEYSHLLRNPVDIFYNNSVAVEKYYNRLRELEKIMLGEKQDEKELYSV